MRVTGVLPAKAKMYDTPGLLHPYIMAMRLNNEEGKMIEIKLCKMMALFMLVFQLINETV
jgi:hypothetical protein